MLSMRFLIDPFLEKSVRDKDVSAAKKRFYCSKSQIKITQRKLKNTILKLSTKKIRHEETKIFQITIISSVFLPAHHLKYCITSLNTYYT